MQIEPQIPKEISARYRVDSLGIPGGMGVVYRGTDLLLQRTVAIKHVPTQESGTSGKHLREAQMVAKVESPHVMQIHQAVDSESGLWMIGEWITGESLASIPKNIDQLSLLSITIQALKGFKTLHGSGIIHRDVKPSNLMINRDGVVKIIDFGVAFDQNLMSGRTIAGTVRYMHPEILAGKSASIRSDLYALGIMFIELFTGEPFWQNDSPIEHYRNASQRIRPRVREALLDMLPPLARCIEQLVFGEFDYDQQIKLLTFALTEFAGPDTSPEKFLRDRLVSRFAPSVEIDAFVAKSVRPINRPKILRLPFVTTVLATVVGVMASLYFFKHAPNRPVPEVAQAADPAMVDVPPPSLPVQPFIAEAAKPRPVSPQPSRPKPAAKPAAPTIQLSKVSIRANAWADMSIDGKWVGRVPTAAPMEMKVGSYHLRLESPLIETFETTLNIAAVESQNFTYRLTHKTGRITIETRGLQVVQVNDHAVEVSGSKSVEVPFGRNVVSLMKDGRMLRQEQVDVNPNDPPITVRF